VGRDRGTLIRAVGRGTGARRSSPIHFSVRLSRSHASFMPFCSRFRLWTHFGMRILSPGYGGGKDGALS